MEDLFSTGKLIAHKGKIISVDESGGEAIALLNIDKQVQEYSFDSVINCTGPETDICKINDTLLSNLTQKGWLSPGPCGLGINAYPITGSIISAKGEAISNIMIIGNHLKGVLWETTAVPELRVLAKKLAEHLLKSISYKSEKVIIPRIKEDH